MLSDALPGSPHYAVQSRRAPGRLLIAFGSPPLFTGGEIVGGQKRVLLPVVLDENESIADYGRARGSPLILTLTPITDVEDAHRKPLRRK